MKRSTSYSQWRGLKFLKALYKKKQNIVSKMRLDTGVDLRITNFEYLEEGYDNDTGMSFVKIFFNSKK